MRAFAGLPGVGLVARPGLRVALRFAERTLLATGRHPTPLIEATAKASAASLRHPGTAEALWHLTSGWQPPEHPAGAVRATGVPTLVLAGADDRIAALATVEATAAAFDAHLEILDGVGHAPHEQVPDQVAEHIRRFLA